MTKFIRKMKYLMALLVVVMITGCAGGSSTPRIPEKAFYFWKSRLGLSASEMKSLQQLNVKKIYIKLFDVAIDQSTGLPVPAAKISTDHESITALSNASVKFVPVVFITNETFLKTDSSGVRHLATKVAGLIDGILTTEGLRSHVTNEIQFDCDWTALTKEAYFDFLKEYRRLTAGNAPLISATIRLYQCKYLLKTGVPPVDRGLLMCYNMGNLRDPSNTGNSIFELAEMEKYTSSLETYPLELDIALPLFDWTVLIRNNTYSGLLTQLPSTLFTNTELVQKDQMVYTLLEDTMIVGYSLRKNDKLRLEESNYEEVVRAGEILSNRLNSKKFTISLYHLDTTTLKKFTTNELENIFNSIH